MKTNGGVDLKSIKPGRGPSMMGVIGGIIAVIFGIFWTIMASSMAAPSIFPLFGILFIFAAIVNIIYNYKNATGKSRMSIYDITDADEEPDPLNKYVNRAEVDYTREVSDEVDYMRFCPYCGEDLKKDYSYCPKCGKKID